MGNKSTSSAGHFDSHGGAPVQYEVHCIMQHVQGSTGSLWTPQSGNYLLCIAPLVTRATGKQTTMKNPPTLLAVWMAIAMHRARLRRSRASLEATGRRHWASICSNTSSKGRYLCQCFVLFFFVNTLKMGAKQKDRP
jgi:hypothetical protein